MVIYKGIMFGLSAKEQFKAHRNALLKKTDWVVIKAYSMGEQVPEEWKTYMQALRDITNTVDVDSLEVDENGIWNPNSIEWPKQP